MPSPLDQKLKTNFKPLDERVIRVSIDLPGRVVTFENLAITVQGAKYTNAIRGDCTVSIANMEKEKADFILKESTPFNVARRVRETGVLKRRSITVEVGRRSIGTTLLYKGDIMFASISEGPDIVLTLQAKTSIFSSGSTVTVTETEDAPFSRIANKIASSLGLDFDFSATEKTISNYSFSGSALKQVDKLNDQGDYEAFIDGATLRVLDKDKAVPGKIRFLNSSNGLVGIPRATERGVSVTMLWDAQTVIGGLLRLESERYPAVNGDYKIYKLAYNLTNRDVPFYYLAECQRLGG